MPNIDNSEDILDSRSIIDRIEEIEGYRDGLQEDLDEAEEAYNDWLADREDGDGESPDESEEGRELADALAYARKELREWQDGDEPEELAKLKAFADDLEGYGDWEHGETLIRESYFTEYCEELCKDIGDLPQDIPGYLVIDWEATVNNLRVDYTESDFDGVTYLMRA